MAESVFFMVGSSVSVVLGRGTWGTGATVPMHVGLLPWPLCGAGPLFAFVLALPPGSVAALCLGYGVFFLQWYAVLLYIGVGVPPYTAQRYKKNVLHIHFSHDLCRYVQVLRWRWLESRYFLRDKLVHGRCKTIRYTHFMPGQVHGNPPVALVLRCCHRGISVCGAVRAVWYSVMAGPMNGTLPMNV